MNELYAKKGAKPLLYKGTDDLLKKSAAESVIAIAAWGGPCGINKELHKERVAKTMEISIGQIRG